MQKDRYDPDLVVTLHRQGDIAAERAQEMQRSLEDLQKAVEEARREESEWRSSADRYQRRHGWLPVAAIQNGHAPDRRYARLAPTGAIDAWADEHGERVVVTELVTVLVASGGQYKTRRKAATAIDGTIRKNKRYKWEAPGVWWRIRGPKSSL